MALSTNEANLILRADLLGEGYARATTAIIKLYKVDGTEIGNGHTGKTIAMNNTIWNVIDNTFTNAGVITGDNNGTAAVTAAAYKLFRPNGTDVMFENDLSAPIEIASGAPFTIPAGEIDSTFGGSFTVAHGAEWVAHIAHGTAITLPDTDVEVDLVSTAPTASAAGTQLVGTGYAPLALNIGGAVWIVTDNVAQLQPGLTPSFGVMGNQWTLPRGVNMYRSSVAGLRMFFQDYGSSITVNPGNQLIFDADTDANTIKITLE